MADGVWVVSRPGQLQRCSASTLACGTARETLRQLAQQWLSRGFFASSCLCIDILGLEEKPLDGVSESLSWRAMIPTRKRTAVASG